MFRTFLTALREARQIRQYVEMADAGEFWQPVDGAVTAKFFTSYTGKKLYARLGNVVYRGAIKACGDHTDGDYQRGIAKGILLAVQVLDQHIQTGVQLEPKDFADPSGAQDGISGLAELALR